MPYSHMNNSPFYHKNILIEENICYAKMDLRLYFRMTM